MFAKEWQAKLDAALRRAHPEKASVTSPGLRLFHAEWFRDGNTVILRNRVRRGKAVMSPLPGLTFIPNKFLPARGC